MKFAESQWLWTLVAIPLLYFAIMWQEHRRRENFARFANPKLWDAIAPEAHWKNRALKARLLLAAVTFALLALARPQWGTVQETIRVSGLDIMIALDVSNSMSVEDVIPSRLQKAKHALRSFVESLRGDRVGLVAFAGSAYVACPLTNDLEYLLESVSLLTPKSVSGQGTDLGLALETAKQAMDRGAEDPQGPRNENEATRVVILLSDGEDHEGQAVEAARSLTKAGVKLFVLGVGTEKGGPIPLRDENGNLQGYKKTRNDPVVSTFQPQGLMQLAQAAGGKYWNVTNAESEIQEMLADLNVLERRDYAERTQLVYQERFQYPLAIAVLLFLIELGISTRRRRPSAALLAALAGISAFSPAAHAGSAPLGAYLENEKGLKAFSEGKAEEAKRHFGAAQAQDPENAAFRYNQGLIQLQEGDLENGTRALETAAEAASRAKDPRLLGEARFNQGAALAKSGNIPGAIQAYLQAIDAARQSGNKTLEQDARKNIQLLAREQEKKKNDKKDDQKDQNKEQQKDQKDQQDQNKDQKDKKEQKDKQDSEQKKKDEKNKEGQENDPQKQQQERQKYQETPKETRQRQFKSAKLSDEDAERVMAELKSRERELQQRLKKQKGNQERNGKDW